MFQKHQYIRSKKLLKLVASLDCQACGSGQMVQAAHSNWAKLGGKAKSLKASDEYTAALCLSCHYQIDQGKDLTKEERQAMWNAAHRKTVQILVEQGKWPANIPIPDTLDTQLL